MKNLILIILLFVSILGFGQSIEPNQIDSLSGINTGDQDLSGYITTETDPIYSAWDKSTGISIVSTQVSDFDTEVSNNSAVTANSAKVSYTDAAAVSSNTTFRTTPSTAITAGTNLSWSGNTLNATGSGYTLPAASSVLGGIALNAFSGGEMSGDIYYPNDFKLTAGTPVITDYLGFSDGGLTNKTAPLSTYQSLFIGANITTGIEIVSNRVRQNDFKLTPAAPLTSDYIGYYNVSNGTNNSMTLATLGTLIGGTGGGYWVDNTTDYTTLASQDLKMIDQDISFYSGVNLGGALHTGELYELEIVNALGTPLRTLGNSLFLNSGSGVNEISTDGTFAGNSDTALPTQKAVKTLFNTIASGEWSTDANGIKYDTGNVGINNASSSTSSLIVDGTTEITNSDNSNALDITKSSGTGTTVSVTRTTYSTVTLGGVNSAVVGTGLGAVAGINGTSSTGYGGEFSGLGVKAIQYHLDDLNTAPSSSSATGIKGEIRYTADYIYICTATNTWKRSALSTW